MYEKLFERFTDRVDREGLKIEVVSVLQGGEPIFFRRWSGGACPRHIYSHTKSFVATAIGIAIDEGAIALGDTLTACFPGDVPENAPEALHRITLRDLLMMSSGFGRPYLMGSDPVEGRRAGVGMEGYVRYMLSRPLLSEPGSAFMYSTADTILAARMLEQKTGVPLGVYCFEKLFQPLGIGWPLWEHSPDGHAVAGGGMFLTVENQMKLGQLYLDGGLWAGTRLVSESWIREATRQQIAVPAGAASTDPWRVGYGYQFWVPVYPGSYQANGMYGQVTTVFPEQGLVVGIQCPEDGNYSLVNRALNEEVFQGLAAPTALV